MRLQDNVIGEILDRLEISDESRDYEFDGGVVSTVDVYPLLDRQESEVLKAVGEWLDKQPFIEEDKLVYLGDTLPRKLTLTITMDDLESLLKGEMPE